MATQTCSEPFGLMNTFLAILPSQQPEQHALQASLDVPALAADALASPACAEKAAITATALKQTMSFFIQSKLTLPPESFKVFSHERRVQYLSQVTAVTGSFENNLEQVRPWAILTLARVSPAFCYENFKLFQ